jgi:hypothetical protein
MPCLLLHSIGAIREAGQCSALSQTHASWGSAKTSYHSLGDAPPLEWSYMHQRSLRRFKYVVVGFFFLPNQGCVALLIRRQLNVDASLGRVCCFVFSIPQRLCLWSSHLCWSHHLSRWWHCLYMILIITTMMVWVSIIHHHLYDTTTQILQTDRSRLRSLRPECHIALDTMIGMSSNEFFSGEKIIFCAFIRSLRWFWNDILDDYDRIHLDIGYFDFKGLSSIFGTHWFLL